MRAHPYLPRLAVAPLDDVDRPNQSPRHGYSEADCGKKEEEPPLLLLASQHHTGKHDGAAGSDDVSDKRGDDTHGASLPRGAQLWLEFVRAFHFAGKLLFSYIRLDSFPDIRSRTRTFGSCPNRLKTIKREKIDIRLATDWEIFDLSDG